MVCAVGVDLPGSVQKWASGEGWLAHADEWVTCHRAKRAGRAGTLRVGHERTRSPRTAPQEPLVQRSRNTITPSAMVTSPSKSKWPKTALLINTKSNTAEIQARKIQVSAVDNPRSKIRKMTATATGEAEEGRAGTAWRHAKVKRRVTPSKAENAKYPRDWCTIEIAAKYCRRECTEIWPSLRRKRT